MIRCAAWLAGLLLWGGLAHAHFLDPRHDLDAFVRRSDVIAIGRVVEATRSEKPEQGMFPLVTKVAVEKLYRGEAVGRTTVLVRGGDDHAVRYKEGLRVLLFLQGRPGLEKVYPADQQKGEEILLGPGDEAGWDAYFAAVLPALKRKPELVTDPGFRQGLFGLLGASSAQLREHALRRCTLWLAGPTVQRAEVEAALRVVRARAQPDRHRLAVLRAALRHLTAADLAALAREPGDRPMMRGTLLEVWSERAAEAGAKDGDREAAAEAALAALREADPILRVMAAAALARGGDVRALPSLEQALLGTDLRFKRVAIAGLGRLAEAGRAEARALLEQARSREADTRVQGWLGQALPAARPGAAATSAGAAAVPGYPTALWVGLGVGGLVVTALSLWGFLLLRRRRTARR